MSYFFVGVSREAKTSAELTDIVHEVLGFSHRKSPLILDKIRYRGAKGYLSVVKKIVEGKIMKDVAIFYDINESSQQVTIATIEGIKNVYNNSIAE